MRTSRLSRDTSKLLAATRAHPPLPPTRTTRTTRTIRDGKPTPDDAGRAAQGTREAAVPLGNGQAQSDSELRSVLDWDTEGGETATAGRKRKRGQAAPIAVEAEVKHEVKHEVKREVKQETTETALAAIASPPRQTHDRPKRARRAPAKRVKRPDGSVAVEPPPNWEEVYALTRAMRNEHPAPVDTMGCASLADRRVSPRDQRFQTLVALMLSSQTKDTVTSVAIKSMQQNMPGGFCLESVLALDPAALNAFINKVGFHNLKTKYIKQAAEMLRDKWSSDIPDTIEGLTSLPGVGPKMAYLCMSAAWGRDEGIGVDVHVHRITNLWGWHKTTKPEETRAALESWLPKDKWHDINNLLVGHGQTICLPVGRRCGECKLADRGLCPSAVVASGKTAAMKENESTPAPGDVKAEHDAEPAEGAGGDMEDFGKAGETGRAGKARRTRTKT